MARRSRSCICALVAAGRSFSNQLLILNRRMQRCSVDPQGDNIGSKLGDKPEVSAQCREFRTPYVAFQSSLGNLGHRDETRIHMEKQQCKEMLDPGSDPGKSLMG